MILWAVWLLGRCTSATVRPSIHHLYSSSCYKDIYLTGCLSTKIWRIAVQLHRSSKFCGSRHQLVSRVGARNSNAKRLGSRLACKLPTYACHDLIMAWCRLKLSIVCQPCRRHATCSFQAPHFRPREGPAVKRRSSIRGGIWDLAICKSLSQPVCTYVHTSARLGGMDSRVLSWAVCTHKQRLSADRHAMGL